MSLPAHLTRSPFLTKLISLAACLLLLIGAGVSQAAGESPSAANAPKQQTVRVDSSTITGVFAITPGSGTITGPVEIRWDNGDLFTGTLVDGKRNGPGRFSWQNGQIYDGDWHDDRADGKARILFPSGDRYDGEVLNGVPNGRGIRIARNGDRYEGLFTNGVQDIEGNAIDANGDRYTGQWKKGLRHGKGKLVWANGNTYEGDWVDGQPQGRGVFTAPNGDRYEGQVRQGLSSGAGVQVFGVTGDRYQGQFENGQPHGDGQYTWKSGDQYTGKWQQGKKSGPGRFTWVNGDYWEGVFKDDQQTAEGQMHFTPVLTTADAAQLSKQTQDIAHSTQLATTPPTKAAPALNQDKLLAIPMVSKFLRECQRQQLSDCQNRISQEAMEDRLSRHKWQLATSDKDAKGRITNLEVDSNSELADGNVFSWLRTGDSTTARKIGIKYDCGAQTLAIQLIYQCSGADLKTCTLDQNFDKYAGRTIPATEIKKWFAPACERI